MLFTRSWTWTQTKTKCHIIRIFSVRCLEKKIWSRIRDFLKSQSFRRPSQRHFLTRKSQIFRPKQLLYYWRHLKMLWTNISAYTWLTWYSKRIDEIHCLVIKSLLENSSISDMFVRHSNRMTGQCTNNNIISKMAPQRIESVYTVDWQCWSDVICWYKSTFEK